ncbi:rRNA methyltransferase [Actinoplanes sp. G11-F43]|uniref:rRNA methyltransferase n=1 Tax=Actinoplanes sp. G11-F43 TaxID=3424130 RepID=UPI003D350650
MSYRFATTAANYADLASGSVLQSAPGHPAFPVRLASEMFQRGCAAAGMSGPVTVWDPCCGSGYLLTVLGFQHRERLSAAIGSDIDENAVALARRNFSLLTADGLRARTAELSDLATRFGKPSHAGAVEAAGRLTRRLTAGGGDLLSSANVADALDPVQLAVALGGNRPQVVLTDVPYGEQTVWQGDQADAGIAGMLTAVAAVLPPEAVIVVAVRGRKVPLDNLRPIEKFRVGTRAVALLRAGEIGSGRGR